MQWRIEFFYSEHRRFDPELAELLNIACCKVPSRIGEHGLCLGPFCRRRALPFRNQFADFVGQQFADHPPLPALFSSEWDLVMPYLGP